MGLSKNIIAGILLVLLLLSCNQEDNLQTHLKSKLIIGNWVIDSIKTPTRRLVIGTYSCILGKLDKRRHLEFKSDHSARYIKADLDETTNLTYSITNDSILSYASRTNMATAKTINYVDNNKLILSDTVKIDGCIVRRPVCPGDKSWPFEQAFYFYHKE